MTRWSWNDETKVLTVYCRESETPLWEKVFDNFENAKDCADSFNELYEQGVRRGKLSAVEEMRRTVDCIYRGI